MGQFSWPWPDTSVPGPTTGDGRKVTAEEYAAKLAFAYGSGVLPTDNELEVTSSGANTIDVDSGAAIVQGRFYLNDASVALTPASAGAGTTRKDSVVLECDWDGSGSTAQYTVRVITKEGTAGAYPAMTQTVNVRWQDEIYRYTIDDAGAITGITDVRVFSTFNTRIATAMLIDGILSADATGRAKVAAGFFGADAASRAKFAGDFFDAATTLAKFDTDSFTNAVLLKVVKDGAFQADAATRALFADKFVTLAKLADGTACSVIGRSANSAGVYADIAAGTNGHVLRRAANTVGFGTIGADSLAASINAQPLAFNSDTVDGLHAADIAAGGVIAGAIIMWSGNLGGSDGHRPMVSGVANEDWHLCNGDLIGSVQTPDLRDKFIVGAGSSYVKGATGGQLTASHNHAVSITSGSDTGTLKNVGYGDGTAVNQTGHVHPITGNTALSAPDNRPPYYGLYYIMKVA